MTLLRRGPAPAFLVLCGALVAAVLVLGLGSHARDAGPVPVMTLRDPGGQRVELGKLRDQVWVASLIGADCLERCAPTVERLAQMHDGLPPGVPLVTFVLGGRGIWPSRPQGAEIRERWIVCQGNATDAADERAVRELASGFLHVPSERIDGIDRKSVV